MMIFVITTLIIGLAFTAKLGAAPERYAVAVLIIWATMDQLYHLLWGSMQFRSFDPGHFLLALGLLVALVWLMLHANRVWPMAATGAQLVVIFGHLSSIVVESGMRRAFWVITQLPVSFIMIALFWGVLAHTKREKKIGKYRDWSFRIS